MYGKHFASMYTGSMVGTGPDVHAVWGYVLALKRGGVVELNPVLLMATIGKISEKRVIAAIEFLCSPDPNSRNKAEEGRRLVREGQFQYRVVSSEIYDGLRNDDERREYNAQMQRESRARAKMALSKQSTAVIDMSAPSATSAHVDVDSEVDQEREQNARARGTAPLVSPVQQTETFGIKNVAAIFSELRVAAKGAPYRRGVADYAKACEVAEWALAEHASDPEAAVRQSAANYIRAEPKKSGWPFAWWANDPGRWHAL